MLAGREQVFEEAITTDVALVRAARADRHGNAVFHAAARNFNPPMATAARMTVAEVEHLVEPGDLHPDAIVTPGIFVQRLVHAPQPDKRIEQRTTRRREDAPTPAAAGTDPLPA